MANVSNPQVLSTLIDLNSQQGNNLKIDTKTAKKIQAETVALGDLLLSLDHQFNGVDSEGTTYFDALSENLDERYIDALDTPHKELQERYEKAFELFLDEIEGKPSHEADKLSPAELKKISDVSLKDLGQLEKLAESNSSNKEVVKELAIAVATTLATSAVSVSATAISVNLLPIITTSLLCAGPKVLESLADKTMTPTNADRVKQALKVAAPAFAGLTVITGGIVVGLGRLAGSVVARTAANADVVDRGLKQLFGTGVKKDVAEVLVKSVATTLGHYAGGAVGESVARGQVPTKFPQLTHETTKPVIVPKADESATELRPYFVTKMLDGAKQTAVSLNDWVKQHDVLPNLVPLPGASGLPVESTKTEIQPSATVKEVGVRQVDPSQVPAETPTSAEIPTELPTNQHGVVIGRTAAVADAILAAIPDEIWLDSEGMVIPIADRNWDNVTPEMLDSITLLYFTDNDTTELKSQDFKELSSLKEVYIFTNQLNSIPEGLFTQNINLESVHLFNNQLTSIPEGLFTQNTNLEFVNLSNNQLTSIPEGLFTQNTNLETVYLSNNQLTSIPEDLFDIHKNLTVVGVNDNPMVISFSTFESAMKKTSLLRFFYGTMSNRQEIKLQLHNHNHNELELPVYYLSYTVNSGIQWATFYLRYDNTLNLDSEQAFIEDIHIKALTRHSSETDAYHKNNLAELLKLLPKENQHGVRFNSNSDIMLAIFNAIPESAWGDAEPSLYNITPEILESIDHLNLDGIQLETIEADDLSGLSGLLTINLSNNQLKSIPENLFSNNPIISEVNLSNNKLKSIPENLFSNNPIISEVNLSNNELTVIPDSLNNYPYFSAVTLSNNPIRVDLQGLIKLKDAVSESYKIFYLNDTPDNVGVFIIANSNDTFTEFKVPLDEVLGLFETSSSNSFNPATLNADKVEVLKTIQVEIESLSSDQIDANLQSLKEKIEELLLVTDKLEFCRKQLPTTSTTSVVTTPLPTPTLATEKDNSWEYNSYGVYTNRSPQILTAVQNDGFGDNGSNIQNWNQVTPEVLAGIETLFLAYPATKDLTEFRPRDLEGMINLRKLTINGMTITIDNERLNEFITGNPMLSVVYNQPTDGNANVMYQLGKYVGSQGETTLIWPFTQLVGLFNEYTENNSTNTSTLGLSGLGTDGQVILSEIDKKIPQIVNTIENINTNLTNTDLNLKEAKQSLVECLNMLPKEIQDIVLGTANIALSTSSSSLGSTPTPTPTPTNILENLPDKDSHLGIILGSALGVLGLAGLVTIVGLTVALARYKHVQKSKQIRSA